LKKVAFFKPPIKRCFLTTIHHAITTISPANYHQKNTHYLPNLLKNTSKNSKNSTIRSLNIFSVKLLKTPRLKHPAEALHPE